MNFSWMQRNATKLTALLLVILCFALSQPRTISSTERARLAEQFHFTQHPLPDFPNYEHKLVRKVHPSLERLSAWVSATGASIALADLDGDGLPNDYVQVDPRTELVIVGPVPTTGSRYKPFILDLHKLPYNSDTMAPTGALVGDINEDGLQDVVVYFWGRTPIAFLQKSGKTHELSADDFAACELLPRQERWYTDSASLADLDGDGHLDLLIGNYCPDGSHILDAKGKGTEEIYDGIAKAFNGGRKHFLLFQHESFGKHPQVSFVDADSGLSKEILCGWTTAAACFDLDSDQLPEIYLANDAGPDRLLHNLSTPGHLKFALLEGKRDLSTPKSSVLGKDSFKGMGVDVADINQDGRLDIYVSNIASRYKFLENHFLWLNNGKLSGINKGEAPFVNESDKLGLSQSGWAWDCRLADFNNDGTPEAIQAMGFIKGNVNRWPELQALSSVNNKMVHDPHFWPSIKPGADISGHEGNAFFVKASDGRYYDLASELGLNKPMLSRGIAVADVDGDGDLDFVVANQWETSYYFRNDSQRAGNFLGLKLVEHEASGSRPLIGAQAVLYLPNGNKVISLVDGGSGHAGKKSQDIFFGLGQAANNQQFKVDLFWRGTDGKSRRQTISVTPGWHTVTLAGGLT